MMSGHVIDQLNAYIDQELNEEETKSVRHHLSQCLSCQGELNQLTSIKEWLTSSFEMEPVPTFLDQKIMSQINQFEKVGRQLEIGMGVTLVSLGLLFFMIHTFFNHGLHVLYAIYRLAHSLVRALPQLVHFTPLTTGIIIGFCLLVFVTTFPLFWRVLRAIAVEDRRGWQ